MRKLLILITAFALGLTPILTFTTCVKSGNNSNSNKININTDKEKVLLDAGQSTNLTINNFIRLKNVNIIINNQNIATINNNFGDIINLKALKPGTTTATLTASNAHPRKITITVNEVTINTDKKFIFLNTGQNVNIKIINFYKLKNAQAVIKDTNIVKINGQFDELISLQALQTGTTTLTISADNADDKEINITTSEVTIKTDKEELALNKGQSSNLTITNFDNLKNVQVTVKNPNIAKVTNQFSEIFTLHGFKTGTTKVVISADNAPSKEITIVVSEISINIDKKQLFLNKGQSDNLTITNFDNLKNVQATVKDPNIAKVTNQFSEIFTLHGFKVGTTTVVISADNAPSKEIIITVNEVTIKTNITLLTLNKGEYGYITISDFEKLKNVQVTVKDNNIVKVNDQFNDIINIQGLKPGTTTVTISADNAADKVITITVNKVDINTSKDTLTLNQGQNGNITIADFDNLKNVKVKVENESIVQVNDQFGDIINFHGLKPGTTTVTISADNAADKVITITVSKLNIETNVFSLTFNKADYGTLIITNFAKLKNVTVKSNDTSIVNINGQWGDIIRFQGLKIGTTTVTISADNTADQVITININEVAIETNTNQLRFNKNDYGTLIISNFGALKNVTVKVEDENIVKITGNFGDVIKFKGLKKGKTTIIKISADNGISKDIIISINKISTDDFLKTSNNNNNIVTKRGIFNYDGKQIGGDNLVGLTTKDILGLSNNIIATTHGVYNKDGEKIGDGNLAFLEQSDFLGISNNIIATTKGVYNAAGMELGDNKFKNLKNDDFLGISNNIIATTKGIFSNTNKVITKNIIEKEEFIVIYDSIVVLAYAIYNSAGSNLNLLDHPDNWTKDDILGVSENNYIIATTHDVVSFYNNDIIAYKLDNLTKAEFLGVSDNIIATTRGVYDYYGQKIGGDNLDNLKPEQFLRISTNMIVTSKGIYKKESNKKEASQIKSIKNADNLIGLREEDILGFFPNIIATTRGIFNSNGDEIGEDKLVNLKLEDILGLSNNIIVTTKGVYNKNGLEIGRVDFFNLTANDILGISETLIITTKGVYNNLGEKFEGKIFDDLTKEEVLGTFGWIFVTTNGIFANNRKEINIKD